MSAHACSFLLTVPQLCWCNCWEELDCSLKWSLKEFQKCCLLIPPFCWGVFSLGQFQVVVFRGYVPLLICQLFAEWCFVLPLQSTLKGVAEKVCTCYSSIEKVAWTRVVLLLWSEIWCIIIILWKTILKKNKIYHLQ